MTATPLDFRQLFDALAGRYVVLRPAPGYPVLAASASYRTGSAGAHADLVGQPLEAVLREQPEFGPAGCDAVLRAVDEAIRERRRVTIDSRRWSPPVDASRAGGPPAGHWCVHHFPVVDDTGALAWVVQSLEPSVDDAQNQAEAQRAREQLIIDNLQDYAVFMVDADGRVTTWNRGAERLLGYREEEVLDQPCDIFFTPEDRARGEPQRELQTTLQSGRAADDRWHLRKDGSRFFVTGLMSLLRDPTGRVTGIVKIMRDVTDRQLAIAERELLLERERAAREEAERNSQLKDEFLATLSHELRTPLNAILGWTHVLQLRPDDPDEWTQGLEVIERNTRAQAQLIDDLLDMSRIVSGKLRIELERLDLSAPVKAAIESVRPAVKAKRLQLHVTFHHAATVMGDRSRLQQVLWNLLTNAIKFTPPGGSIGVTVEREGAMAVVTVRDSGQGIDPEFLPHVFDRFRQADSSTTRQHGGLGLGLAIVKQLVELQGGDVRAHSEGGGSGAKFVVRLPVVEPAHGAQPDAAGPPSRARGIHRSPESLQDVRVLAVDDEPDSLRLIQRLLEGAGATVVTAMSVDEALEVLDRFRPDVLLSDIGMPGKDGYELIAEVRRRPDTANIPAAAVTALARAVDRTRTLHAGFQTHVCKPIEAPELVAVVSSLASLRTRPEPPE